MRPMFATVVVAALVLLTGCESVVSPFSGSGMPGDPLPTEQQ